LLLLGVPAAGIGLWLFPDVYSDPDPGPKLFAGACTAYGSGSPACDECRRRGYKNCDERPKSKVSLIAEGLSADCSSMSVEALRGMVDSFKVKYAKLAAASGDSKKDQAILKGFSQGREKASTACPYFEKRIKELQTGDYEQTTATLKQLAQCVSRRADAALARSGERNYDHEALHKVARSLYDVLIDTQEMVEDIAKRGEENKVLV
jgi:hypothetical protein